MSDEIPSNTNHLVLLACGHWFVETWPPGVPLDPGQPRACGTFEHYPSRFAAAYLPVPEQLPDRNVVTPQSTITISPPPGSVGGSGVAQAAFQAGIRQGRYSAGH